MSDYKQAVNQHYAAGDIGGIILNTLASAGKDLDALTPADLAPVDQFHTRGRAATDDLIAMANPRAGESVLDVGGGIGGSARLLAQEHNCNVTVLDLTEEFVRAGEMLTERTHLQDRVKFKVGSALDMPFDDNTFDLVWTQHSTMNIADKSKLFAEIHRVLKPGGRYALNEIMAGPVQPIYFPAPWATTSDISFLETPETIHALLESAGFHQIERREQTDLALEFVRQLAAGMGAGKPPPLGLHLLLGDRFVPGFRNLMKNFEEQRVRVISAVYRKP